MEGVEGVVVGHVFRAQGPRAGPRAWSGEVVVVRWREPGRRGERRAGCFAEEKDDVDDDAELRGPAGVSFVVVVVVPATAESLLVEASSFVRAYRACAWSFFPWR